MAASWYRPRALFQKLIVLEYEPLSGNNPEQTGSCLANYTGCGKSVTVLKNPLCMLSVTWHSHNNAVWCREVARKPDNVQMWRPGDGLAHCTRSECFLSLCLGWGCGVCFKERGKESRKRRGHTTSSISLCPLIVISRWVGMKIWSNSVCTTRSAPLGKVTQVATTPVITRSVIITKWKEAYRRSFDLFHPGKKQQPTAG